MPGMTAKGQQVESLPPGEQLYLDLDGFEGPLDMLLHLAQAKKLDLSTISLRAAADQYLRFIGQARVLQLEQAGEYLLMAAWLIYIKSRLLLPQQEERGDNERQSAAYLRFRLARLAAMRAAAEKLFQRNLLGEAVFPRGLVEETARPDTVIYQESLYAVLAAYANGQKRRRQPPLKLGDRRSFWSLAQARLGLTALLQHVPPGEWLDLRQACAGLTAGKRSKGQGRREGRSALAGSFAAGLEMARKGRVELRQKQAFAPLYLRLREADRA